MKENRTYRYLYKTILGYGGTFVAEYNNLSAFCKAPIGSSLLQINIVDVLYYSAKNISIDNIQEFLFLEFETRGPKDDTGKFINPKQGKINFNKFLQFVRGNAHYVHDYWTIDGHVIVLKVNKKYSNSYKKFLQSKYSEMYDSEEVKSLGYKVIFTKSGSTFIDYTAAVLLRDDRYGPEYLQRQINERFGTNVVPENPKEYDLPWLKEEEFQNYNYLNEGIRVIRTMGVES